MAIEVKGLDLYYMLQHILKNMKYVLKKEQKLLSGEKNYLRQAEKRSE